VLAALHDVGVTVWLDGGWGVDALLGAQHREHGDLDVVMALDQVGLAVDALAPLGYSLEEDARPTRAVLRSRDRGQIDIHPVTFDARGVARQKHAAPDGGDCVYPAEGFTAGTIEGTVVSCLSPQVQLAHHLGYEPRAHDRADMRRLADRFGLQLPAPYDT